VLAVLLGLLALPSLAAADPALPPGFQDEVVFGGLDKPTAVRFASNGMVFVAEKNGKIEVYENLEDETPELFKDLTVETYDHGDRGLLGLAIDPQFPAKPYVYALFTYDHVLGEEAPPPKWGTGEGDFCPVVPENGADDCLVSGRLVRYTAKVTEDGEGHLHAVANGEKALIPEDWCQQFSSHSIGDLRFGPEGALYAGGGDGASFSNADYGQFGEPPNPCGDPPKAGGSLRAQDLLTPETEEDPTNLSGTIIRIDPETGEGWPTNPLAKSSSANERRIVGLGFRNPFRFTLDPKTGEMYVGNVGSSEFEEIDRFDPTAGKLFNSGWPCYEGDNKQFQFEKLGLPICERLYEEPELVSKPLFYYSHRSAIAPGDECSYASGSAISGPAFYEGEEFPVKYEGALFFADTVRGCFYVMLPGEDGRPDPSKIETFMTGGSLYPGVDIEEGPDGSLYYASLFGEGFSKGAIHRITYAPGAPSAKLTADTQYSNEVEHEFHLDASKSSDPTGEELTFEWDLNGDGKYEKVGTEETQTVKFTEAKNVVVAVRVKDGVGLINTAKLTLYPGDTPPVPTIKEPAASYQWGVGDEIHLSGSAINSEGKSVEPLFLSWSTRILHCPFISEPTNCHAHPLQDFPGVSSGNLIAPEHDYPSYLEITLTASDKRGLSASKTIKLSPRVFTVHFASNPPGIPITAGLVAKTTPFEVPSVEGAQLVIAAPESTQLNSKTYTFQSWSDGGAPIHTIVAKGQSLYTATYTTPGEGGGGPGPQPPTPELPVTQLRKHPPKSTRSRIAKFVFGANVAGAKFTCKLDGKPKKACHSPATYKHLKPGKHTFKVWATVGVLTDSTPARFSWKILK
jgi:glucose/arabinose dehydrogenase